MSWSLFVDNYLQVTWRALSQWKGILWNFFPGSPIHLTSHAGIFGKMVPFGNTKISKFFFRNVPRKFPYNLSPYWNCLIIWLNWNAPPVICTILILIWLIKNVDKFLYLCAYPAHNPGYTTQKGKSTRETKLDIRNWPTACHINCHGNIKVPSAMTWPIK